MKMAEATRLAGIVARSLDGFAAHRRIVAATPIGRILRGLVFENSSDRDLF